METTNNTPMPDDHNDVTGDSGAGAGDMPKNPVIEEEPSPTPQDDVIYASGENVEVKEKSSVGSIIGAIIIVLIIIIGGLFIWGQRLVENGEYMEDDEVMEDLQDVDASNDDIDTIEAELDASNFEDIDSGIDELESEL